MNRAEAEYLYGVQSLSSRISELRNRGFRIRRELVSEAGKRYALYRLSR